MTRRRPDTCLQQLELPLSKARPTPDHIRQKWAELLKWRKQIEYRRILDASRVEHEQLPN